MQPLLLLHGAIGSSAQLQPLAARLGKTFKIYTLDFSGHGGMPVKGPFSIELFATDVLQFMEEQRLDKASIFGYSMGGYVGMYLAKHHPEKVDKIITLATKYHWTEAIAAKEIQMLDPEKIAQKLPAFAETLMQRHAPYDWKEVLTMTSEMMIALGNDAPLKLDFLASITTPALLLLGDRDKMVSLEETVTVYKTLPAAQMGILPGMQHPIENADLEMLGYIIEKFL